MSAAEKIGRLRDNIQKVFIGRKETVNAAIVGLLSNGHLLIEDIPGVGKTMLAKALALSIDVPFSRIQFTPDLLPADILGVSVFSSTQDDFVFKKGPIFANVVLADEINRTTPRTQSSLLEAMNDLQVSMDGVTYDLPRPFLVLATQNPHEFEGTYPLPESQLDRFLMRIDIGYPTEEQEKRILHDQKLAHPIDSLKPVLSAEEVVELQKRVRDVSVEAQVSDYLVRMIQETRRCDAIEVGGSPRASLNLYRAAQARALSEGRDYCMPDDVKALVVPILSHRLIGNARTAANRNGSITEILLEIVDSVRVPI
ncbi:MAG: MoxR family ATPase [Planctomycetes bacterium]|nr:MoxR family ATPase [Planctomycetota bacterium]